MSEAESNKDLTQKLLILGSLIAACAIIYILFSNSL